MNENIKAYIAVISLIGLYEIIRWGITGIVKDIYLLKESKKNKKN